VLSISCTEYVPFVSSRLNGAASNIKARPWCVQGRRRVPETVHVREIVIKHRGYVRWILRALRLGRGMSQEELAHVSGYHRNYIGILEREKEPFVRTLFNLAGALTISPSDI